MRILFGWAANILLFWSLLLLFTLYVCELLSAAAIAGNPDASWQTLLLSWIFSILLRLVVNEHGLLVLSKGMRRSWQGVFRGIQDNKFLRSDHQTSRGAGE